MLTRLATNKNGNKTTLQAKPHQFFKTSWMFSNTCAHQSFLNPPMATNSQI